MLTSCILFLLVELCLALVDAANDKQPEVREMIMTSLHELGKKQPEMVLSSIKGYLIKHQKVRWRQDLWKIPKCPIFKWCGVGQRTFHTWLASFSDPKMGPFSQANQSSSLGAIGVMSLIRTDYVPEWRISAHAQSVLAAGQKHHRWLFVWISRWVCWY